MEERSPRPGGVLRLRQPVDPWEWDVTYAGLSNPNQYGVILMSDGLLSFATGPDIGFSDVRIAPGLAERWEASPDATSFTFHLRRGITFASGRELTSADVKWSYEYLTRTGPLKDSKLPQSAVDWVFTGMDAIETPDPYTVVVRFKEPVAAFLGAAAADNYTPILPREVFEADGHFKERLPGPGPFHLDQAATQKGTRWVFKKTPGYYLPGRPYVDEMQWLILPDDGATQAAFRTKQLDLLGGINLGSRISAETGEVIRRENPQAVLQRPVEPPPSLQVFLHTQKPPFNDVRVRKALGLSINRDEFIQARSGGQGAWSLQGAMAGLFTPEELKQFVRYDPEEAKRILREAGHPDGVTVDMFYPPSTGDDYVSSVQLFQAQLRKGGINLNLKPIERNEQSARYRSGEFWISLQTSARFVGDVSDWVYSIYLPGTLQNFGRVDDPKLTALIKATQSEPDSQKRRERTREAVRYAYENAWGFATHHGVDHFFSQSYVKGVHPSFWAKGVPVQEVWLDR